MSQVLSLWGNALEPPFPARALAAMPALQYVDVRNNAGLFAAGSAATPAAAAGGGGGGGGAAGDGSNEGGGGGVGGEEGQGEAEAFALLCAKLPRHNILLS